jgi:hypothetical protein
MAFYLIENQLNSLFLNNEKVRQVSENVFYWLLSLPHLCIVNWMNANQIAFPYVKQ